MKKISMILIMVSISILFAYNYANRKIEPTDVIEVFDSSGQSYTQKYSNIETFIETYLDGISSVFTFSDSVYCADDITVAKTVQAEHLYSTDDGNIADSLYVGDDLVVGDDATITGDIIGANAESINNTTNGIWQVVGNMQSGTFNFINAAGTANAITMDFTPDLAALTAGLKVCFVADSANTGATTLTIDGGDTKNIYEAFDVSALEANDIKVGMIVECVYDGTQWQQISQSGN